MKRKHYLWIFFKIGFLVLGGGYVIQEIFYKEFVEKTKMIESDRFNNYILISNSSPGAVGINATFALGYYFNRLIGGILSVIALLIGPIIFSFIGILLIANSPLEGYFQAFIIGVNIASIAIILKMSLRMIKNFHRRKTSVFIFIITILLIFGFKMNNFLVILIAFVTAFLLNLFKELRQND